MDESRRAFPYASALTILLLSGLLGCGTSGSTSPPFAQLAEDAPTHGSYVQEFETTRYDGLWVTTVNGASQRPVSGTEIHAKRRAVVTTNEGGHAFLKAPVPDSLILKHDAYRNRLYTRASTGVDSVLISLRPASTPVSERVSQ